MITKFNTKPLAIFSLILFAIFAVSGMWVLADDEDDPDDENGDATIDVAYSASEVIEVAYSASEVIKKGDGATIDVVNKGNKIIKIWVDSEALDEYMIEQGINEVNLTVDVIETYVKPKKGKGHYELDFIFGPSGAFFTPDLEVRLEGVYYNSEVWMYTEAGEALETYKHGSDEKLYFLVPHFSRYSYDHYDS